MGFPGDSEMQVQFLVWENPQERGNGNPLQYSCQKIPMDREACRATVHRISKSRSRLSMEHMIDYTTKPIRGE